MDTFTVKVAARTQATHDITCFDLVSADARPLPAFTADAHINVHLADGMIRAYSLWNDSAERGHYRIAVLREPQSRGSSATLCDHVRAGDTLTISPPRNRFRLQGARHTLLLGGGIGVTPLLSMAGQLARMRADFTLHYDNKTRSRAAFLPEIAAAPWAGHAELHFSDNGNPPAP